MTGVTFLEKDLKICGFEITGHSSVSEDDLEGKTVCAAISSAAYMAANTVGEIIGDKYDYAEDEKLGKMYFCVLSPSEKTVTVLEGFRLHIEELCKQYSNRIEISRRCKKC